MPTLSVVIITLNEAQRLPACLESVRFADEVIVLDSGSRDETAALAQAWGARVETTSDWPGFGPQKNRAVALARCDWVLSLDADEQLTPALQMEIQAVLRDPKHEAYALPRLSSYCGRFIHHSGWWPDEVPRLFKKETGRFSDDAVHERLLVSGSLGRLKAPLLHHSFAHPEDVLSKMNRYSSASAQAMAARGKRATIWTAILHGWWAFVRTYFLRRGFLDGREGFLLAVSNAEGSYYRYVKLMYLVEEANQKSTAQGPQV